MGDDTALAEGLGFKSFRLLRWLMATMRAVLLPLRRKQRIQGLPEHVHQFVLLSTSPEKEKTFVEMRKKHGSFFAFHGSAFENFLSILRNGLKNASATPLQSCGAVYGHGIYLGRNSGTSLGYCRRNGQAEWKNSMFKNCMAMAVCEVAKVHMASWKKTNTIFVVPQEECVVTRFLLVSTGSLPNVEPTSLKFPNFYTN